MMKTFNITGTCRVGVHYMVDISERVGIMRGMVAKGDYFCINRGRQYGKTTTLEALAENLKDEYSVSALKVYHQRFMTVCRHSVPISLSSYCIM